MATIVCQGLQSCLEESMTLRLKLSTKCHNKKPQLSDPPPSIAAGWSFFQIQPPKEKEDQVYVHPLLKSRLSEKSLEMCTENLGSENGSDRISDDSIFSLSSSDSESGGAESSPARRRRPRKHESGRRDLPPPLTTISGSDSLRIRSRREDGRVVMEAVKVSSAQTSLRSERSHGRLRLYILDSDDKCDREIEDSGNRSVEIGGDGEETEHGVVEEKETNGYGEDMGGIEVKDEGRMGIEELQRPSRCKEGGESERKGLMMNWEPFCWVATS